MCPGSCFLAFFIFWYCPTSNVVSLFGCSRPFIHSLAFFLWRPGSVFSRLTLICISPENTWSFFASEICSALSLAWPPFFDSHLTGLCCLQFFAASWAWRPSPLLFPQWSCPEAVPRRADCFYSRLPGAEWAISGSFWGHFLEGWESFLHVLPDMDWLTSWDWQTCLLVWCHFLLSGDFLITMPMTVGWVPFIHIFMKKRLMFYIRLIFI